MPKQDPILTVLLLTYNHEDSVAKALDSILEQKTNYAYEIWIAEDKSTDHTLKICKQYIAKYPGKIKLYAQPTNTKARHIREVITKIKTPYLTVLEGDDEWSDKSKLQKAIKFLESNPEYSTFAHDTIYNDIPNKTKQSLVHDIHKTKISNPVNMYESPYLHTSARTYRNTVNLAQFFKDEPIVGDINLFYAYLDQGPLYYYDKAMSVYNIDGTGSWTKYGKAQQTILIEKSHYRNNQLLSYRHDDFFSSKVSHPRALNKLKKLIGKKAGWKLYIFLIKNKIIK